jgi:hypothetical protein
MHRAVKAVDSGHCTICTDRMRDEIVESRNKCAVAATMGARPERRGIALVNMAGTVAHWRTDKQSVG